MSLQHAILQVMDYAARGLDGLAEADVYCEHSRFAATRFRAAMEQLSLEPINRQEIRTTLDLVAEARPSLQKLFDGVKADAPQWGWVLSVTRSYEGTLDLLRALEALHEHITLERTDPKNTPTGLQRLLPAAWWGNR